MAYDGDIYHAPYLVEVVLGGRHSGYPPSRKRHLRRGTELKIKVGVPRLITCVYDIKKLWVVVIEVVHAVSIIIVYPEIVRSPFKGGHLPYHLIRKNYSLRIGVHGNAPHALYQWVVFDIAFYKIHVGSVFVHGYIYHLYPEVLR